MLALVCIDKIYIIAVNYSSLYGFTCVELFIAFALAFFFFVERVVDNIVALVSTFQKRQCLKHVGNETRTMPYKTFSGVNHSFA
jgi:hypothetical protein